MFELDRVVNQATNAMTVITDEGNIYLVTCVVTPCFQACMPMVHMEPAEDVGVSFVLAAASLVLGRQQPSKSY